MYNVYNMLTIACNHATIDYKATIEYMSSRLLWEYGHVS